HKSDRLSRDVRVGARSHPSPGFSFRSKRASRARWLDAIGYTVQVKEKKNAAFWFVATGDGTAVDIRRRSAPADHSVTIASLAEVPEGLRRSLASMDPEMRRRALKPIARELLRSGVDVDLAAQLSAPSGSVVVSDTLAVSDDLTEAEFARTIDEVTRGSKLL